MGTTTRHKLPYPEGNTPNDVAEHTKALAEKVDDTAVFEGRGSLVQRPAAGVVGRRYWSSDGGTYRDSGTEWVEQPRLDRALLWRGAQTVRATGPQLVVESLDETPGQLALLRARKRLNADGSQYREAEVRAGTTMVSFGGYDHTGGPYESRRFVGAAGRWGLNFSVQGDNAPNELFVIRNREGTTTAQFSEAGILSALRGRFGQATHASGFQSKLDINTVNDNVYVTADYRNGADGVHLHMATLSDESVISLDPVGIEAFRVVAAGDANTPVAMTPGWLVSGSDVPVLAPGANGAPPYRIFRFTDITRSDGSADPLHYAMGGGYVLNCQAFAKGNSGEAVPLVIANIDGERVHIPPHPGLGNRKVEGCIIFSNVLGYT